MTTVQRRLLKIALLLVAAGIAFGFVHAALVRYNTIPVLQYRAHWTAASLAAQNGPAEAIEAAQQATYAHTRVIDAHTHIIKLATVLLLVAILYPLIAIPEKRKRQLTTTLAAGICLFPLGVLSEIYLRAQTGQALAAIGAILVILSFAGLAWGLLRSSAPHIGD